MISQILVLQIEIFPWKIDSTYFEHMPSSNFKLWNETCELQVSANQTNHTFSKLSDVEPALEFGLF